MAAIGGTPRAGQQQMAEAVADTLDTGEHLLVQAGTGTGKSLAYLVPVLAHHDSAIISTATIALQRQLVDRDLPRLVDALEPLLGRRPVFAMLKGRSNYLCLHRLNSGEQEPDDEDALFAPTPTSKAGRDVVRIRKWAEQTETGDRDEVLPAPDDRAWRSLSVTPHECLGAQRCPFADDCWAEIARERAREADVVVTNHAMLAIDALSDARLLPESDVIVVDEAHELADRATGAVTDELTAPMVERAARRSRKFAGEAATERLLDAAGGAGRGARRSAPRAGWARSPDTSSTCWSRCAMPDTMRSPRSARPRAATTTSQAACGHVRLSKRCTKSPVASSSPVSRTSSG